jgi:hypothetical protein
VSPLPKMSTDDRKGLPRQSTPVSELFRLVHFRLVEPMQFANRSMAAFTRANAAMVSTAEVSSPRNFEPTSIDVTPAPSAQLLRDAPPRRSQTKQSNYR